MAGKTHHFHKRFALVFFYFLTASLNKDSIPTQRIQNQLRNQLYQKIKATRITNKPVVAEGNTKIKYFPTITAVILNKSFRKINFYLNAFFRF